MEKMGGESEKKPIYIRSIVSSMNGEASATKYDSNKWVCIWLILVLDKTSNGCNTNVYGCENAK